MAASWRRRRSGSPIVIAIIFIGREYETKNYSFEEVNHFMAEKLAVIAKEHGGIMRFVQVSCLGTSPSSPSRMLKAKAAAEEATLRELPVSLKDCMAFEHEADSDLRVRRCRIWQVFAMRKEDRRQPLSKVNGGSRILYLLSLSPVNS